MSLKSHNEAMQALFDRRNRNTVRLRYCKTMKYGDEYMGYEAPRMAAKYNAAASELNYFSQMSIIEIIVYIIVFTALAYWVKKS